MSRDPIGPGRLVWEAAPSGRGEGKPRPLIIAIRRTDYLKGRPVLAIGCSTRFTEPLGPHEIRLPYRNDGKGVTRLREDSVAVCDWIERFPALTTFETRGMIPGDLLREILQRAGIVLLPER